MAYENGPGFSDGKREVLIKPVYPNYEGYPSGWWRTYSVYKFAVSKHVCEGKVPDTTDDDGVHDYRYSIWACPGSIWDSIWACSGSISNGMAASLEYHHPSLEYHHLLWPQQRELVVLEFRFVFAPTLECLQTRFTCSVLTGDRVRRAIVAISVQDGECEDSEE